MRVECALPYLLLAATTSIVCVHAEEKVVTVGAVLSSAEYGQVFMDAILSANMEEGMIEDQIRLNGTYIVMDDNPIRAAMSICDDLIPQQVYGIL